MFVYFQITKATSNGGLSNKPTQVSYGLKHFFNINIIYSNCSYKAFDVLMFTHHRVKRTQRFNAMLTSKQLFPLSSLRLASGVAQVSLRSLVFVCFSTRLQQRQTRVIERALYQCILFSSFSLSSLTTVIPLHQ